MKEHSFSVALYADKLSENLSAQYTVQYKLLARN